MISGVNMLRGFLIFLIFIWKPSVWRKIVKRHPRLVKILTFPAKYIFTKPVVQEDTEQIPLEQINLVELVPIPVELVDLMEANQPLQDPANAE